jgi:serine/threonine protein kinase
VLSDHEFICIAKRCLQVLALIHKLGLMHRDIKALNFMISPAGIFLIDFGMASEVPAKPSVKGTSPYMAPEIWTAKQPLTEKVDLWALGILFIELLTHGKPTDGIKGKEKIKRFILANQLIVEQPEQRPSADTLLANPLFTTKSSNRLDLSALMTRIQHKLDSENSPSSEDVPKDSFSDDRHLPPARYPDL